MHQIRPVSSTAFLKRKMMQRYLHTSALLVAIALCFFSAVSNAAEETKVGGTTVEETKENCARKSEQKKRKDGKKSSKEGCQECTKKTNTSCLQKYAMRGLILFFRLTKTLKERESWFEKQLLKKIGNYSKRSKFF